MGPALRRHVVERAHGRCEYCLLSQSHQILPFHIEHIIARQHGGGDSQDNLAFACHRCNLHKGPNLSGIDPQTTDLTRLFHPREHAWGEHFAVRAGEIVGLTPIGRATVAVLDMNDAERVNIRLQLISDGLWPPAYH